MSGIAGLIERLEKATEGSRVLDAFVCEAFDLPICHEPDCLPEIMRRNLARVKAGGDDEEVPDYTSSIDAALALTERVLPGAWYVMAKGRMTEAEPLFACELLFGTEQIAIADGPTQALAVLSATLRALLSQEKANG